MTMTVQVKKKKRNVQVLVPSKKLLALLDSLVPDMKKTKQRVKEIFDQSRKEGFPDDEIGSMIRMRMDGNYTERYIRMVLPETAKRAYERNVDVTNEKKSEKISETEHKDEIPNLETDILSEEQSVESEPKLYQQAKSINDIGPSDVNEAAVYFCKRYKESQFELNKKGTEVMQLRKKVADLEKRIGELEQENARLAKLYNTSVGVGKMGKSKEKQKLLNELKGGASI